MFHIINDIPQPQHRGQQPGKPVLDLRPQRHLAACAVAPCADQAGLAQHPHVAAERGGGDRCAKLLTPTLEGRLVTTGAPAGVVGIDIAALVLLPEGLAVLNAARADRLQSSMNLAWSSALSTIGPTIPAVAVATVLLAQPIVLGLSLREDVLLAPTLLVSIVSLGPGRTTMLQGMVHPVIFASFLLFAVAP